MGKFKVGDAVKFKPAFGGQTDRMDTPLDLYYTQTISEVMPDGGEIKVLGDDDWWDLNYWEHIEEWAKHQKPVYGKVELELTKQQVAMPQDNRKASVVLLRKAAQRIEDVHAYELAEEINKFLGEE